MIDIIGAFVMACILLVACVAIGWAIYNVDNEHAKFMQECQQDRKEYECTAMWRSGDKSMIYIHTGR